MLSKTIKSMKYSEVIRCNLLIIYRFVYLCRSSKVVNIDLSAVIESKSVDYFYVDVIIRRRNIIRLATTFTEEEWIKLKWKTIRSAEERRKIIHGQNLFSILVGSLLFVPCPYSNRKQIKQITIENEP